MSIFSRWFVGCMLAMLIAIAAHADPFRLTGNTPNIAVTGTAQNLAIPTATAGTFTAGQIQQLSQQLVLSNIGTQTIFIRFDGVTVTVSNGLPMLANSQFIVTVPPGASAISVIAATTGSTLYASVGVGQ